MDKLIVEKIDEVYMKIYCEPSIAYEISDFFTFDVPGAKFMPSYKSGMWDGKIRLFNSLTGYLYCGLISYLEKFCSSRTYQLEYKNERDFVDTAFSLDEAKEFCSKLNLKFQPRDYQLEAFTKAIRSKRSLLLSPTASGKSFIIYLLLRYYSKKTLIIVPTTSLVHQMASDFKEYGYDKDCHKIYSGQEKITDKDVTITTWQSIYKNKKNWFSQFDVVIGDEAHQFKAKSLVSILEKMDHCKYRFGFTGTLDGSLTNKLVLEGLFGAVFNVTTTSTLIKEKHLSDFRIKAIVLKYPEEVCKSSSKFSYADEMDFIVNCEERNKFIKNLTLSLEGNTLLLFQYVDKHGKKLYNMIKEKADCPVFFVHGGISGDERERIRKVVSNEKKSIIIASFGTFSTGINIPSIQNVIFASPSKSKIRNLQSIGRVLRKHAGKTVATLFDISDDMSTKSKKNFTILHFMERVKIYNAEKFDYKIYKVSMNI